MYPTKQVAPLDSTIDEVWSRDISDTKARDIHGVDVSLRRASAPWSWHITVWAMEYVRRVPLEKTLRGAITDALLAVPGVVDATQEDREVWIASGEPTGAALVEAVAAVVDGAAGDIRALIDSV